MKTPYLRARSWLMHVYTQVYPNIKYNLKQVAGMVAPYVKGEVNPNASTMCGAIRRLVNHEEKLPSTIPDIQPARFTPMQLLQGLCAGLRMRGGHSASLRVTDWNGHRARRLQVSRAKFETFRKGLERKGLHSTAKKLKWHPKMVPAEKIAPGQRASQLVCLGFSFIPCHIRQKAHLLPPWRSKDAAHDRKPAVGTSYVSATTNPLRRLEFEQVGFETGTEDFSGWYYHESELRKNVPALDQKGVYAWGDGQKGLTAAGRAVWQHSKYMGCVRHNGDSYPAGETRTVFRQCFYNWKAASVRVAIGDLGKRKPEEYSKITSKPLEEQFPAVALDTYGHPTFETTTSNNAEQAWPLFKKERETADHFAKAVGIVTKMQAMYHANKREAERLGKHGKTLSPFYEDLIQKRSEASKKKFVVSKWQDDGETKCSIHRLG